MAVTLSGAVANPAAIERWFQQGGRSFVTHKTIRVWRASRVLCPTKTGKLKTSIQYRVYSPARGIIKGDVYTNLWHGLYIQKGGTHSYSIEPVKGKALSWISRGQFSKRGVRTKGAGRVTVARVNNHPPLKAEPFMVAALRSAF